MAQIAVTSARSFFTLLALYHWIYRECTLGGGGTTAEGKEEQEFGVPNFAWTFLSETFFFSTPSSPFRLAFFFFSLALACSRARSLSRSLNSQLFLSLSLQKTQPPHHSDRDDLRLPTAFAKIVLKDRETPATRGSGADRTCQVREERAEKGGNLFSLSHFLRLRLRLCLLFFSLPLFLHSPSFSFIFPRLLLPQPPLRSKTAPTA